MKIPKRIANTLINALKGGVVPRIGLPYVTVGRSAEIDAVARRVDLIEEECYSFRCITDMHGSGTCRLMPSRRNTVIASTFL